MKEIRNNMKEILFLYISLTRSYFTHVEPNLIRNITEPIGGLQVYRSIKSIYDRRILRTISFARPRDKLRYEMLASR